MVAVRDMSFSTSDKSIVPCISIAPVAVYLIRTQFFARLLEFHSEPEAEVLKNPLDVNDEKMAVESSAEEVFLAERIVDSGFGQVRC